MGPVEIIERKDLLRMLTELTTAEACLIGTEKNTNLAKKKIQNVAKRIKPYIFQPSIKEK